MAQIAKMEVEAEIKASAAKFYEVFCSKGYLLPKICPNMIKDLRVLKGGWGTVGSVKQWTYVAAGNSEIANETVEAMDEKTKSITFKAVDGELLKVYKSVKTTVQVTAKGGTTLHGLISDCKRLWLDNWDCNINHIYRECNNAADGLAHIGHVLDLG